ncbi:hypothetical protein ACGFZK_01635 [Streptomyces sp. NPDC048257]|uniref:hypothetical protein n=1 Tax=Streptomyces sp. NPDC048257 TaxID=3365526 RepID=UPI00371BFAB9
MATDAPQQRPGLLPDLVRSRAVLVACDDDAVRVPEYQPAARAAKLAAALVAHDSGMPFKPEHVRAVMSWQQPAEVLDAVRRAAEEASDVLLFHYVGTGRRHREFAVTRDVPGPAGSAPLRAVADIVRASRASRRLVLLDCDDFEAVSDYFTSDPLVSLAGKSSSMYFRAGDDLIPAGDEFTETLADALRSGITDGPELLDLATLRDAVEGRWALLRYHVENEYIGAPDTLHLTGGQDLALGTNLAFGPGGGHSRRPFHRDAAAVDLAERWWD